MSLDEPKCRKCRKNQSQLKDTFISVYGFCNKCHLKFMSYLREAIQKFLKSGNRKGTGKKSWKTRRKSMQ